MSTETLDELRAAAKRFAGGFIDYHELWQALCKHHAAVSGATSGNALEVAVADVPPEAAA